MRATRDGGSPSSALTAGALNRRRPSTESSKPMPLAQLDLVFITFPCSATGVLAKFAGLREHTLGSHKMEHRKGKEVAHQMKRPKVVLGLSIYARILSFRTGDLSLPLPYTPLL